MFRVLNIPPLETSSVSIVRQGQINRLVSVQRNIQVLTPFFYMLIERSTDSNMGFSLYVIGNFIEITPKFNGKFYSKYNYITLCN
jgi:hypothetical protein